jgi:hypothetical protein
MYTTIIHPLRKAYNLSITEYCVLDSIYMLSHNSKYGGWCIASKKQIAEELDLAERTVFNAINTLITKGLIEKSENGNIKTLDEWNELIANKHDYAIAFNGKEQQLISGKFSQKPLPEAPQLVENQHFADTMQNLQSGMQKMQSTMQNLQSDSAKIADNIYKYNNNNNNNDNIIPIGIKEQAPKAQYGNKEINLMLEALKGKIGIDDFADSQKWARIYGKHCIRLMDEIGKDEFVRRLEALLADSFHSKNCNKIKYVYNNIKGFIEPKSTISTFN